MSDPAATIVPAATVAIAEARSVSSNSEPFDLRVIHRGWNTFGVASVRLADGTMAERAFEHHGEAAVVLPYDPARRTAILVRQARVAPLYWGEAGDLDEAPAGGLDGGEPAATAIREAFEEAGVRLTTLDLVVHGYTMPGVSSERLYLYLAPYGLADRIGPGGGLAHEGEQIVVAEVPLAELGARAAAGTQRDLKTLLLVQALMLRRPDLFAPQEPAR